MADRDISDGSSDEGSGWDDDFTDDTVLLLDRIVQEQENQDSSDDSDYQDEESVETTTTPGGRRWVPTAKEFNKTPPLPAFDDSDCGVTQEAGHIVRILDYFQIFFGHWFLQMMVNATNTYACRERAKNPEKHKCKWTDINIPELVRFLALSMLMGIIRKSRLKDYWSTLDCICTPYFTSVMKRDKFTAILRYLNFPSNEPDRNPNTETQNRPNPAAESRALSIRKMNWLFEYFNGVAKAVWKPSRDLAIDESMVSHKGRTSHKQYMPAKPTKWGMKVWVCAESLSGYVIQAFPHFSREDRAPFRIYEDVVLKLLRNADLLGQNRHIYFDNYYTSVPMFDELAAKFKTFCCGTLRVNRKELPKPLMQKKHPSLIERGQCLFSKSGNLILALWKDRKLIRVLSTIHGTNMSTCLRRVKEATTGHFARKTFDCPLAIREYSRYMGGVDLADQMYKYYCLQRKSKKWTKKLFWYLLELMKLNASIMFNSKQEKKMTLYDFSLQLIDQIITETYNIDNLPRPIASQTSMLKRLINRCMPANLSRKSYCRVCYHREKNGFATKKRQTKYGCDFCGVHLCLPECFRVFHTVENFENLLMEE